MTLPPSLSNLYDVFHVSQFRKYVSDLLHVISMNDVQVRDNLIVEALTIRIDDRELKQLRGKDIALVNVVWGGAIGRNMIWELESMMRESYPKLFASGNFRGRKCSKWGRVVTPRYYLNYFP